MKERLDDDPVLRLFNAAELRIAAEFLTNCLPFLSKGLCNRCIQTLGDRIRSLDHIGNDDAEQSNQEENVSVATTNNRELTEHSCLDYDMNSVGSWNVNDTEDTNSLGSWKGGVQGWSEPAAGASTSETVVSPPSVKNPRVQKSWADMAQEDELAEQEDEATAQLDEDNVSRQLDDDNALLDDVIEDVKVTPKTELSRDQREHIRFNNVKRKKDFKCFEHVNGRLVNILQGLELHCNVFSAVEQKRIVDFVQELQDLGKNGKLKDRTYTAPQKWMKGKGRVTIQFGCCYNYATDKFGNPPGILRSEMVDPIPHLFKVIIKRLIRWHVLPPTCIPDSCIVNVYDEGDCIPPHVDNHDFLRPFCTLSFVSECNIVFGLNLKVDGPGEFSGAEAIPLPVGSVLVINGNSADLAKHCVPAVGSKRISITFRKMDESKWPIGFAPEPDLQGLQPLSYETNGPTDESSTKESPSPRSRHSSSHRPGRREEVGERSRGILGPEPRFTGGRRGTSSLSWQKVRVTREF